MTKVLFANHVEALPEKTIQRIPCAVSPTPVSRCGVGLPARLAAGRLRHEDVGAQRRLGRQGASVQVSNEDGRGPLRNDVRYIFWDFYPLSSRSCSCNPLSFGENSGAPLS